MNPVMNWLALNELSLVHAGMLAIIVSLFSYLVRTLTQGGVSNAFRWVGWVTMAASASVLGLSMVGRSVNAGYFALSNMYESLLMLIIWMQVGFLLLDAKFRVRGLGWPAALLILVALAYDTTLSREIRPLQAALQSYWRSIHVPIIIFSYAMFTLSFVSSVVYLVRSAGWSGRLSGGTSGPGTMTPAHATAGGVAMESREMQTEEGFSAIASRLGGAVDTLHPLAIYDELTYRCVMLGFPLLIIGIILGGLWANEAWGNYWSWDPKESMSLATLLGYGVYLHLRVNGEHSPKVLSWVAVGGFVLLLVTYFGVNIMGLGLHSYGKIE